MKINLQERLQVRSSTKIILQERLVIKINYEDQFAKKDCNIDQVYEDQAPGKDYNVNQV